MTKEESNVGDLVTSKYALATAVADALKSLETSLIDGINERLAKSDAKTTLDDAARLHEGKVATRSSSPKGERPGTWWSWSGIAYFQFWLQPDPSSGRPSVAMQTVLTKAELPAAKTRRLRDGLVLAGATAPGITTDWTERGMLTDGATLRQGADASELVEDAVAIAERHFGFLAEALGRYDDVVRKLTDEG